ncbi:MAG: hypothetical protein E7643_01140 [Ruminococcaceae bacterium]|nr:hypothetical protein [Oscillospiraceae bacterium]
MKFSQHYTVKWHDTDLNRCVTPSAILMYMQETAGEHLKSLLFSMDELRDRMGLAFLLSSISIYIHEPLYADDEIDVQTWVCESRGLSYNRCFCILRDGKTIAEASSVWGLLDIANHRLLKADESPFKAEPEAPCQLPLPRRLQVLRTEDMEEAGDRRIVYSDIDYNGHMNNTHYPNLLCDFTPDICKRRVKGLMLSFLHEAAYGHTLRVYRGESADGLRFRIVDADGTLCTEALLCTEEIQ